jgi:hypothetical protein
MAADLFDIRLPTLGDVLGRFDKTRDGIARAAAAKFGVINPLPHALPVETGRTRSGRWVRRAGPARMLARGAEQAAPQIAKDVVKAIPHGAGAVDDAFEQGAERIKVAAQGFTPVQSCRLRGAYQVRRGRA